MTKIAYILLCHQDPDAVIEQTLHLTGPGDYIAIHFDKGGSPLAYRQIRTALAQTLNVVLCQKRIKCAWGGWSLVQATLNTLQSALTAFPDATHSYLILGNCMPIKPIGFAHDFLSIQDVDYIESFDYFESDWIKQGQREDRLIYRHYFNQRTQTRRFEMALALQKRFGLSRAIPSELEMQIGSQWWCLRRQSIEKILKFLRKRCDIKRFFKTTWIPDETLFQTLVRHLIPSSQIMSQSLTFLIFSDYGMPVTFYNDHYDLLRCQNFLFARKISPEASGLKTRLLALSQSPQPTCQISDEGTYLYRSATHSGRLGLRHGWRF